MKKATTTKTSLGKLAVQRLILPAAAVLACGLTFAQGANETQEQITRLHCNTPIAKVMMGKLTCKAASCNSASAGNANPLVALLAAAGQPNVAGIGDGIKDMLTTALQETGCFEVMDRDSMEDIKRELEAAGRKMDLEVADFLVTGSVTQIDVETSTTNIGWGMIPVIGSVGRTTQRASAGLDIRMVSVANAKVLNSKRIEASTEDSSFGVGGVGFGTGARGAVSFGGSFTSLKGTSLEKVTRDAVFKAAGFLVLEARKAKGESL